MISISSKQFLFYDNDTIMFLEHRKFLNIFVFKPGNSARLWNFIKTKRFIFLVISVFVALHKQRCYIYIEMISTDNARMIECPESSINYDLNIRKCHLNEFSYVNQYWWNGVCYFNARDTVEAYSEPSRTSKMELFARLLMSLHKWISK